MSRIQPQRLGLKCGWATGWLSIGFSSTGILVVCLSVFLNICAQPTNASNVKHPNIPLVGSKKDDFAPDDWTVMSSAEGDLNGDKKNDAAIVLALAEEPGVDDETNPDSPRCLVIATRGADGKLHRVLADWTIIPEANAGGAGVGEAFQSLEISKGVLALCTLFGSNDRSQFNYRYRLQGNRLKTIDLDYTAYNSSEAKGAHIQVDPMVGLATCSNEVFGSDDEDEHPKPKKPITQRFYIVTVEPAKALNLPAAHSIQLAARDDVTSGKAAWKGASDLSARIRAVCSGKKMSLTAEVTDDVVTASDTIRLLNEKGKVITARSSVKSAADKGYVQTNEYDLASISDVTGDDLKCTAVTVEVLDFDATAPIHCAMSTSRGGLKYPGQFAFCKEIEMGALQSILESKNLY